MFIDPDGLEDVADVCAEAPACLEEARAGAVSSLQQAGNWSDAAAVAAILDFRGEWSTALVGDLRRRLSIVRTAEATLWLRSAALTIATELRPATPRRDGATAGAGSLAEAHLAALKEQIDNWPGTDNDPILDRLVAEYHELQSQADAGWYLAAPPVPTYVPPPDISALLRRILDNEQAFDEANAGGDDDVISRRDLAAVAGNAALPTELRTTAQYFLDNPILWNHISSAETGYSTVSFSGKASLSGIRTFLAENETLRALAAHFLAFDSDGDGLVGPDDLERLASDHTAAPEARLAAAHLLADARLTQRLAYHHASVGDIGDVGVVLAFEYDVDLIASTRTAIPFAFRYDSLLSLVIDRQALTGHPQPAADLVLGLESTDGGSAGISIDLVSDEGLQALAATALESAPGDLIAQHQIVAHLPESAGAVRNRLITAYYDLLARRADALFANLARVDVPGHHWLVYAPWASNAVRGGITGETTAYGVGTNSARQALADGNQWIFSDIGARFAAFLVMYEANHSPTERELERFFAANFGPGDGHIMVGFAAYVAALNEPDPLRAQTLMFQANSLIATHEQAGVQPYLERLDAIPLLPDSWFHGILTRVTDLEMGGMVVDVDDDDDFTGFDLTDNLIVGQDRLSMDSGLVDLSDLATGVLRFTDVGGGSAGVIDVPAIEGIGSFSDLDPLNATWFEHGGGSDPDGAEGAGAGDWIDWEERMWAIQTLFEQTHTEARIVDFAIDDVSVAGVDWLEIADG